MEGARIPYLIKRKRMKYRKTDDFFFHPDLFSVAGILISYLSSVTVMGLALFLCLFPSLLSGCASLFRLSLTLFHSQFINEKRRKNDAISLISELIFSISKLRKSEKKFLGSFSFFYLSDSDLSYSF